ncbi:TadE family type IV pilus minor pilin [Cryobacterium psychrophilum]|uniref:TadE-like domain-containing protein n=1 Tax=Cryobacterium psychrophilum TaxID=41988 RepID=A0A4Y8KM11_9MICO|nr:TadE family type IV pilus minor pilin [Cryobacterium psychrophilum]TDW30595.1 TadE-like protein [Cryobacterium psychrophilum]TFD77020.1 hypothetical protein E3T53_12150 [Cryobacterium psychrophilum]
MRSRWAERSAGDAGTVTAELAIVLPAVVLVLGCCLGAVQVVGQQVRLTDAAADAARALSRGDAPDQVAALVANEVRGAGLAVQTYENFVCARLSVDSSFAAFALTGLRLEARSCALAGGL